MYKCVIRYASCQAHVILKENLVYKEYLRKGQLIFLSLRDFSCWLSSIINSVCPWEPVLTHLAAQYERTVTFSQSQICVGGKSWLSLCPSRYINLEYVSLTEQEICILGQILFWSLSIFRSGFSLSKTNDFSVTKNDKGQVLLWNGCVNT